MPNGRFKYGFLSKYPHLNTADRAVWERFLSANPDAYESVDYDFALDEQSGAEQVAGTLDVSGAERVFNFRVDVVAYRSGETHIIELKDRADSAAVGQVGHYRDIYIQDHAPSDKIVALIIAGSSVPRLDEYLQKNNVGLLIT